MPTDPKKAHLVDPEITPGTPGEGESAVTPTPTDGGFTMPEKFTGKSAEDIAKSFVELEKTLGQRSQSTVDYNKIGELIDNKLTNLRPSVPVDPDVKAQRDEQIKLGRELGFATREDVDSAKESGRREAMLAITATQLETKYSGKDGEPAFKQDSMVQWLNDPTTPSYVKQMPLERAFQERFSKEFRDIEIRKALQGNRAPIVPKGGPKPTPSSPDTSKMSEDQRRAHIKASLEAGQYE